MHPYYRDTYNYSPENFPTAASLHPELITLPLYPDMTEDDVRYVCDSLKEIIAKDSSSKRILCRPAGV
jgi:dTDP-4-amino-4,6-dideoxygalactose transaminase